MAQVRQLGGLQLGEYVGTVTWTERIAWGSDIERCAEMAPIKVTKTEVILHLDHSGERVKIFRRKANKSAQVYFGKTVEQVATERAINYRNHSTRCLCRWPHEPTCQYRDDGPWLAEQVTARVKALREASIEPTEAEVIAKIDRAEEEAERVVQEREERKAAKEAGLAEWTRVGKQWFVRVPDRHLGDVVTVRTKAGKETRVKLSRKIQPDVWEHEAA